MARHCITVLLKARQSATSPSLLRTDNDSILYFYFNEWSKTLEFLATIGLPLFQCTPLYQQKYRIVCPTCTFQLLFLLFNPSVCLPRKSNKKPKVTVMKIERCRKAYRRWRRRRWWFNVYFIRRSSTLFS